MDLADNADRSQERLLEARLAEVRRAALAPGRMPSGQCDYCGEAAGDRLYCSTDCRDDHEHELALRRRAGQQCC